jgi:hypothetical protein
MSWSATALASFAKNWRRAASGARRLELEQHTSNEAKEPKAHIAAAGV